MHALVLFAVAGFLTLGWWQAIRAGEGNPRSYGYAAEWPTFAIIVIFLWIRAMRMELKNPDAHEPTTPAVTPPVPAQLEIGPTTDEQDPELAAYNNYLADLNRRDAQSRR